MIAPTLTPRFSLANGPGTGLRFHHLRSPPPSPAILTSADDIAEMVAAALTIAPTLTPRFSQSLMLLTADERKYLRSPPHSPPDFHYADIMALSPLSQTYDRLYPHTPTFTANGDIECLGYVWLTIAPTLTPPDFHGNYYRVVSEI